MSTLNKIYVIVNGLEVEKNNYIISNDTAKAKTSFDNYSTNWT
jgi:hypothetical protein